MMRIAVGATMLRPTLLRLVTQKYAQQRKRSSTSQKNQVPSWLWPSMVVRSSVDRALLNRTLCVPIMPLNRE